MGRLDWEGKAGQGVKQRQCMEEKAIHGEKGCAGRERDGQGRKACLKALGETGGEVGCTRRKRRGCLRKERKGVW